MKARYWVVPVSLFCVATTVYAAAPRFVNVRSQDFDPKRTYLVQAQWLEGIGCPTSAKTAPFLPPDFDTVGTGTYTDAACPTGDSTDKRNTGLLLVKTGPTNNNASADATLVNVARTELTELGYDIRKNAAPASTTGSTCSNGSPRFNIETTDGSLYFVACNSPAGTATTTSEGWTRLRWGGSVPLEAYNTSGVLVNITGFVVKSITIVFDEGQDATSGPPFFGLAVLDNIDVNGTLVGSGTSIGGGGAGRTIGHGGDQ
jgi:hypothetical protein